MAQMTDESALKLQKSIDINLHGKIVVNRISEY